MTIEKKSSDAKRFIKKLRGGPMTFGNFLKSVRTADEIKQSEFAKSLGISRAHLCDIEKGRRFVAAERAAKFAKKLGYSVNQFISLALQDQVNRTGYDLKVVLK
ncbi:MAG: helix-turn-helix transcriptional regulator [Deltaproteobacteria bacterium]|nr:helix-turn-helix transcriptional regulator [Deltaproteobacteria bacterium]